MTVETIGGAKTGQVTTVESIDQLQLAAAVMRINAQRQVQMRYSLLYRVDARALVTGRQKSHGIGRTPDR